MWHCITRELWRSCTEVSHPWRCAVQICILLLLLLTMLWEFILRDLRGGALLLIKSKTSIDTKIRLNHFSLPGGDKLTKLRCALQYRWEHAKQLFASEIYFVQSLSSATIWKIVSWSPSLDVICPSLLSQSGQVCCSTLRKKKGRQQYPQWAATSALGSNVFYHGQNPYPLPHL